MIHWTSHRQGSTWHRTAIAIGLGAVLGIVLLHPVTMTIYWFEFRADLVHAWASVWGFVGDRMAASFTLDMAPMTLLFAALGAGIGSIYAALDARLRRSARAVSRLEQEIAREVPALIGLGESEHIEFKASARWEPRAGKMNKALGDVVAQTIASFANHQGGSLLVGVADDGAVVGLDQDYRTLKKSNRDGFANFIMTLVKDRLGGHVGHLVHVLFAEVQGKDVCRIVVEPASRPVFFNHGGEAHLFVRVGNSTRELDAREVLEYVSDRWNRRARRAGVVPAESI